MMTGAIFVVAASAMTAFFVCLAYRKRQRPTRLASPHWPEGRTNRGFVANDEIGMTVSSSCGSDSHLNSP